MGEEDATCGGDDGSGWTLGPGLESPGASSFSGHGGRAHCSEPFGVTDGVWMYGEMLGSDAGSVDFRLDFLGASEYRELLTLRPPCECGCEDGSASLPS
jgi:hypothetical protein